VWTGSNNVTEAGNGKNCSEWLSSGNIAIVGDSAVAGARWWNSTQRGNLACDQSARLYCVR
jgi:hypothetical protein